MYPIQINTDAVPVNRPLLIMGIGVAVIVLVVVGALVTTASIGPEIGGHGSSTTDDLASRCIDRWIAA